MEYKNTYHLVKMEVHPWCLNPCSNGIQKYNQGTRQKSQGRNVLILVLMEYKNTWFSA